MAYDTTYSLFRPDGTAQIRLQSNDLLQLNATIAAAIDKSQSAVLGAVNPTTLVRTDDPRLAATPAAEIMPRLDDVEATANNALSLAQASIAPTDSAVAALVPESSASETYTALAGAFITEPRGGAIYNLRQFSGANAAEQINNAAAAMAASGGGVLQVSEDITLSAPITLDMATISLDFQGHEVDASAITDAPAFAPTSSATTVEPETQKAVRNLVLTGPGSTFANSVGMRFRLGGSGPATLRGYLFENLVIRGFRTGLSFGANSFLLTFHNAHVYQSGTCVAVENKAVADGANTNYGENIRFESCGFGSSNLVVSLGDNLLTDVNFLSCSFDLLQGTSMAQQVANVSTGQVNIIGGHIELDGPMSLPVFYTANDGSARVTVSQLRIQHNNSAGSAASLPHLAQCDNAYWGGGVTLRDVHLHYVFTADNFLAKCAAPGLFQTSGISFPSGTSGSGFGRGVVLTAEADNRLTDPTFASATHQDFYLDAGTGITSRTASTPTTITNSTSQLVVTRNTTGSSQMSVLVPVTRGKYYSTAFQVASTTCTGNLRLNQCFVACRGTDTYGTPVIVKQGPFYGAESAWDVTTLPGVTKAFNGGGWPNQSMQAPPWATHFRVNVPLTNLTVGNVKFSKFVITEL